MKLVSIVVPVYNTKKEYLDKCILSLLRQTYKRIEIIIIDDGSKRECANYCDKFSEKYENIIVLHKENAGVSSARNCAIKIAKGEYISFVDSDDWVDKDFIENLVYKMEETISDMSIVNISIEDGEERKDDRTKNKVYLIEQNNIFREILHNKNISGYLCNKMFKKSLIKEELNEEIYYSEDFVFCAQYSENIKCAVYNNKKLYHYRQEGEHATADFTYNNRIFSLLKAYEIIEDIYMKNDIKEINSIYLNRLKIALNLRARYKYMI